MEEVFNIIQKIGKKQKQNITLPKSKEINGKDIFNRLRKSLSILEKPDDPLKALKGIQAKGLGGHYICALFYDQKEFSLFKSEFSNLYSTNDFPKTMRIEVIQIDLPDGIILYLIGTWTLEDRVNMAKVISDHSGVIIDLTLDDRPIR